MKITSREQAGDLILARRVYALVREHIEANRPVLTNEMIESWYSDWAEWAGGDQDVRREVEKLRRENERLTFEVTMARGPSKPIWDNVEGEQCTACAGTGLTIPLPQDVIAQLSSQQERINLANLELPSDLDIANEVQVYAPTTSAAQTFFAYGAGYVKRAAVRTIAAMKAENERLKNAWENHSKIDVELRRKVNALEEQLAQLSDGHEVECHKLRAKLAAEFSQSQEYFTELSRVNAENERLDGELSRWRTEHACCGSVVELHKKQDEINKLSDLLRRARADQVEKSRELNARLARIKELEAAHSPQIADDSRRSLKVPSEGDIEDMALGWQSLRAGARWAVKWIKKANGAE